MRTEFCISLAASLALHAGLLVIGPGATDARSSALQDLDFHPQLAARLVSASSKPLRSRRTELGSTERISADEPSLMRRSMRTEDAARVAAGSADPRRFYPREAIEKGIEGEAIVMLRLSDDGQLIDAQIAKSSGYAILDLAALRAVRATPRFAPGSREVLFPVTFTLH